MTGKDALIRLSKTCKALELEFGSLKIDKTDNEALQTLKEIVQKYEKYKRAFEILKKMNGINRALFISAICDVATDEEIELLEELMK